MKPGCRTAVLALSATLSSAVAAAPPEQTPVEPGLNLKEKAMVVLAEQALSLVAAVVDRVGCHATAADYTFDANVRHDASGAATVDDRPFSVSVADVSDTASTFATSATGTGEVADTMVSEIEGTFVFPAGSEKVSARAEFKLAGPPGEPTAYRTDSEQRLPATSDGPPASGRETIAGAELTPSAWEQHLSYRRPGADIGRLGVSRELIGRVPCNIRLSDAAVDDFARGLEATGVIRVRSTTE